jgi:hypothetical protein
MPVNENGDTFITKEMMEDDPEVLALFKRTSGAWIPLGVKREAWILRKPER